MNENGGMSSKGPRILYCDGSCPTNGRKDAYGGWCFVEVCRDVDPDERLINMVSGGEAPKRGKPKITSIRMELLAAIRALESVKEPSDIILHSDSAYLINGINDRWYMNWNMEGDRPYLKTPANLDLWGRLVELIRFHELRGPFKVKGIHIPGHKGHRWQELCDSMARQRANEARNKR